MRRPGLLATVCLLLLCAPVCAQEWRQIVTPAGRVVTMQRESEAQALALRFEQLRLLFGVIMQRRSPHLALPMRIVVVRPEALAQQPGLASLATQLLAAAFQQDDDTLLILTPATSDPGAAAALFASRLLEYNYPRTQPWFDLGLEELFAALHFVPDGVEVGGPHPALTVPAHWIPALQLLSAKALPLQHPATAAALRATAEGLDPQDFAAESWIMLRWLLANQRLGDAGRYFGCIMQQHMTTEEALQQAFGLSAAQLDAELQAFARQPAKAQKLPLPSSTLPESLAVTRLKAIDGQAILAETAFDFTGDSQALISEMEPLLHQGPPNANVQRALAMAYYRQRKIDDMIEHVRGALELSDDDARMHLLYAIYMNQGARDRLLVESALVRMRGELNNAIGLLHGYAPAHELYGLALLPEKREQGVEELNLAAAAAPRDELYLLNLAKAYNAPDSLPQARALLLLLRESERPEIASAARRELEQLGRVQPQQERIAEAYSHHYTDPTLPQWRGHDGLGVIPDDEKPAEPVAPDTRKLEFLKGRIVSVDCSQEPAAVVTLNADGRQWKMRVADLAKVLLIGADRFDCDWRDRPASINYKASGPETGDVVSIEID